MHGVKPPALWPRVGASTGLMYLPTQTPTGLLKRGEAPPTPARPQGQPPSPSVKCLGGNQAGPIWLASPQVIPPRNLSSQAQPAGGPRLSPLLTRKLRWESLGLGVSPPPTCQPPAAVRPWAEQASLSPGAEGQEGLGKRCGGGWADVGCLPHSWRCSAHSRGHCPLLLGTGHPSLPAPPPLGCNYGSFRLIAEVDSLLAPLP